MNHVNLLLLIPSCWQVAQEGELLEAIAGAKNARLKQSDGVHSSKLAQLLTDKKCDRSLGAQSCKCREPSAFIHGRIREG